MGSGLIYAAIIVMWALYFIPRWLRRHEELSESRSVEKFDHAMRILSRREPTPDQRYIVMPPKPEPAPGEAAERSKRRARSARPTQRAQATRPARRRSTITFRRRRVLAALVLVTLIVAVATPFTPVPWWGPLAVVLVTLLYLAHLRVQQRRQREVTRTRHAVRQRLRSRLRRVDSADRLVQARQQLLAERRAAAEAERVAAERASRVAARSAADADGWAPTPVPLPTYVTKPVAPRVGRPIDLTRPGAWTDAQGRPVRATAEEEIFDQTSDPAPAAPAAASGVAPSYDDYANELDQILERRRAVND